MNLGRNSGNDNSGNAGVIVNGDGNVIQQSAVTALKSRVMQALNEDASIAEYFSEFRSYTIPKTQLETVGLSEKLLAGGFDNYVDRAVACKEKFYKKFMKFQNSISFQNVVHVLIDAALNEFEYHIYPMIDRGETCDSIMSRTREIVFDKLYDDTSGTAIPFDRMTIEGLVYFVSGNCYIRWRRKDDL